MHVVILFGEALATPEVFWSIRNLPIAVSVIFRKGSHSASRALKGTSQHFNVTAPETSFYECCEEIKGICHDLGEDAVLLPIDDMSLTVVNELHSEVNCIFAHSQWSLISDKLIQFELAKSVGFEVPPYFWTTAGQQPRTENSFLNDNLIVKPRDIFTINDGRLGRLRSQYVATMAEAHDFLLHNSRPSDRWLIQESIAGVGHGLFGIADAGRIVCFSAHQRLRMMNPAGSGASACISIKPDSELISLTRAFIEKSNFRGIFMVEYLIDQNRKPWFIEFNGRVWGSTALARRCGLEYPRWLVELFQSNGLPVEHTGKLGVVCRHLGRELIHLAFVIRGNRQKAPNWPSMLTTIINLLSWKRSTYWYNFDKSDSFFFLRDAFYTLRSKL